MRQAAYGPAQRRRVILVGAVFPLVLAAAGASLLLAWAPRLPADIVVQWRGDSPSSVQPLPLVTAGLLVPLIVGAIGIVATLSLTDDAGRNRGRLYIALAVAVATTATVALVASVGLQLDGASTTALEVGRRALLGCALALPTATLAFLVTPRSRGPAAQ